MGTWHTADTLGRMIQALPEGCLLVLDEAYHEFAPGNAVPPLDTSNPNVIRMRTFSKAYGLAGARVGYAIGHADLIGAFNRVRNHFGMSRLSQKAALTALADDAWLEEVKAKVAAGRSAITAIAAENGLIALPSATNFVTIDCGQDGAFARKVLQALIARGVFVRMPFVAPQDRCIRVTVGDKSDLDIFAAALPDAMEDARKS